MMRLGLTTALALAVISNSASAFAADADVVACQGKAEGDSCAEADGDPGVCRTDAGDGRLECEDGGIDGVDDDDGVDDERACSGKAAGDACTDDDGESGTCQPDDDDGRLECDDDRAQNGNGQSQDAATDGSSSSSGCSVGAAPPASAGLAGFAVLGAAALLARRRRPR